MVEVKYSERTVVAKIVEWINGTAKQEKLPIKAETEIEIKGVPLHYTDILIYINSAFSCVTEFKPPANFTPYDEILIDGASTKAYKIGAKFFGTWNANKCVLWNTYEQNVSIYDRAMHHYDAILPPIKTLEDFRRAEVENRVRAFLRKFLHDLYDFYTEKVTLGKLPMTEYFIHYLKDAIDAYYIPISEIISKKFKHDKTFNKNLVGWFVEQGWTRPSTSEDFDKAARQFIYLLINKIMFYNILRERQPQAGLPLIQLRKTKNGELLKKSLQSYFNKALKIDYKQVFGVNFIETIPVPNNLAEFLTSFVNQFNKHDFSKLGEQDIGKIYDGLIPAEERHDWGQYFTRMDVVDLINGFCIKSPNQTIADFGCGAGTFLVRAYQRLKYLEANKKHGEILRQLRGVDIAKFPAHLTTINITTKDLSDITSYPLVYCKDFFDIRPQTKRGFIPPKHLVTTLEEEIIEEEFPMVDVVVGNPPYTRQEELEEYIPLYKEKLENAVHNDWAKGVTMGKRAGIHAYFFLHGMSFLREKGRFGYVVSNSWLDVDYGKYLQEFFLNKCKIVAIIEDKTARWFPEADINTCIIILERAKSKTERDKNLVKFVRLKKPIEQLIQSTTDEKERWLIVDSLVKLIEKTDKIFENDDIRIFPKKQKELWEEGYNSETNKYIGSKWSKYIRAPDIFFKILERGENLFIPLKKIADVRRGFTTGAGEFFYLSEEDIKRWKIEKEFWMHKENGKWIPNYVIKSPRECKSIIVKPRELKYRILMIHKDKKDLKGKNVLKYIQWGERQGFHKRPTCASRQRWYDLEGRTPCDMLWLKNAWLRLPVLYNPHNTFADCRFYEIRLHEKKHGKAIAAILNSTLSIFFAELAGRFGLGLGARDIMTYEASNLLIPDPNQLSMPDTKKLEGIFNKLASREIKRIFKEINMQDRLELDKIIFDIIRLSKKERKDVYKAVIDLVKTRVEKARTIPKKIRRGVRNIDGLAEEVLKSVDIEKWDFPDDYIGENEFEIIEMLETDVNVGSDIYGGYYLKVGRKKEYCDRNYAYYIKYAVMCKHKKIKVVKDKKQIKEMVEAYQTDLKKAKKEIEEEVKNTIPNKKLQDKVLAKIKDKIKI